MSRNPDSDPPQPSDQSDLPTTQPHNPIELNPTQPKPLPPDAK